MRRLGALAAVVALSVGGAALGQVRPHPGVGDPRIQSVDYQADQVVLIETAPGYAVTIELAPDEQVQTAAVGDAAAFLVTVNHAGNELVVKPLQAGVATNLTVVTNVRSYAFDLSSSGGETGSSPYRVQFHYARARRPTPHMAQGEPPQGRYRLSGTRTLRPASISDDGVHTYISWADDVLLPATYVVDAHGHEMLANGAMRGERYVVDSVAQHLRFRIDKQVARADRLPPARASK